MITGGEARLRGGNAVKIRARVSGLDHLLSVPGGLWHAPTPRSAGATRLGVGATMSNGPTIFGDHDGRFPQLDEDARYLTYKAYRQAYSTAEIIADSGEHYSECLSGYASAMLTFTIWFGSLQIRHVWSEWHCKPTERLIESRHPPKRSFVGPVTLKIVDLAKPPVHVLKNGGFRETSPTLEREFVSLATTALRLASKHDEDADLEMRAAATRGDGQPSAEWQKLAVQQIRAVLETVKRMSMTLHQIVEVAGMSEEDQRTDVALLFSDSAPVKQEEQDEVGIAKWQGNATQTEIGSLDQLRWEKLQAARDKIPATGISAEGRPYATECADVFQAFAEWFGNQESPATYVSRRSYVTWLRFSIDSFRGLSALIDWISFHRSADFADKLQDEIEKLAIEVSAHNEEVVHERHDPIGDDGWERPEPHWTLVEQIDSVVLRAIRLSEKIRRVAVWIDSEASRGNAKATVQGHFETPFKEFGDDYSWAQWGNERFTFTPNQAKIIRLLVEDHRSGGDGLTEEHLQNVTGVHRVDNTFREKGGRVRGFAQAWGKMIIRDKDREGVIRYIPADCAQK